MGIDLQLLQDNKGGDIAGVIASQKKRNAPAELVEDVLNQYKEWVKSQFRFFSSLLPFVRADMNATD
jgi:seryl-tRNA synthetase